MMKDEDHSGSSSSSIIIGLLNLPKNVVNLSIDGIGLRTSHSSEDFLAITGVPAAGIHWIVWNQKHAIVCCCPPLQHLVLSYNPSTEELAVVTDPVTCRNFVQNICQNWGGPRPGIVTYDTLLQHHQHLQIQQSPPQQQQRRTTTTTTTLVVPPISGTLIDPGLLKLRGIGHGTKIVPGTYSDDDDDDDLVLSAEYKRRASPATDEVVVLVDGIEMVYPSIPVFTTDRSFSIRHVSHRGTKSFLRGLSPTDRTQFFRADHPNAWAMDRILSTSYENSMPFLLADLELSFLLLLHIHCYSSWNHWRDLTVLLLRAHRPEVGPVLLQQLPHIETEVWEEYDADGMLAASLRQYQGAPDPMVWQSVLHKSLPRVTIATDDEVDPDDPMMQSSKIYANDGDEEDDDPPLIVENVPDDLPPLKASVADPAIRQRYPILAAAVLDTEDIVMTCARALDEAKDVSLVREAAAYLEQVEAYRE
jgi:AAR2 protein